MYIRYYLKNANAVVLCHIGPIVIDISHIDADINIRPAWICCTHHPWCRARRLIHSHYGQSEHVNCLPVKMLCCANVHDSRPFNTYTIYLLPRKGKDT